MLALLMSLAKAPAQPAASDAANQPKPIATPEPAAASSNPFDDAIDAVNAAKPRLANPAMQSGKPSEPAAPATPSLAGGPQTPVPADTPKPPVAEVKPSPSPSETNPPATPTEVKPTTATDDAATPAAAPAAAPAPGPTEVPAEPAQPEVPPAATAPQPAVCNPADFRIAIDVGHTETNYGAVSAHGVAEYEFNLRLAQELVQELWARKFRRAEIVTQVDSDLAKRARDLSSRRPNIMLSLHHDSVQDRYLTTGMLDGQMRTYTNGFHGYSIFISRENAYLDDSERFAKLLGTEMRAQGNVLTPTDHHEVQENRQPFDKPIGVYFYDGLAVLRQTTAPAVLLESAVIADVSDEQKANDKAFRAHIVNAIVTAVSKFCDAVAARAQTRTAPPPAAKPAASDKQGSRK